MNIRMRLENTGGNSIANTMNIKLMLKHSNKVGYIKFSLLILQAISGSRRISVDLLDSANVKSSTRILIDSLSSALFVCII